MKTWRVSNAMSPDTDSWGTVWTDDNDVVVRYKTDEGYPVEHLDDAIFFEQDVEAVVSRTKMMVFVPVKDEGDDTEVSLVADGEIAKIDPAKRRRDHE